MIQRLVLFKIKHLNSIGKLNHIPNTFLNLKIKFCNLILRIKMEILKALSSQKMKNFQMIKGILQIFHNSNFLTIKTIIHQKILI